MSSVLSSRTSVAAADPQLHREVRLHFAAFLYFLSRLAVAAFVFAVPAFYFLRGQLQVPLVAGGALLVVSLYVAYYTSASKLRCPACAGPVLMDNGNQKHRLAQRFPGINHQARVAWDILFSRTYHCMYCHSMCRCKKARDSRSVKGNLREEAPAAHARQDAVTEPFPKSVFGDDENATTDSFGPFVGTESGRLLTADPAILSTSHTESPDSHFSGTKSESPRLPESPRKAAPWEMAAGKSADSSESSGIAPTPFTSLKSPEPVPMAAPELTANLSNIPPMHRTSHHAQPEPGTNPFVAAPPKFSPASPILPVFPVMLDRKAGDQPPAAEPTPFTQDFPLLPAAPASDRPSPWTLPSLPLATVSEVLPRPFPAVPSLPVIPDSTIRLPNIPSPAAFVAEPILNVSDDLRRDVLSVLEECAQSVDSVIRGAIAKIESRLARMVTALPVPETAVVPSEPANDPSLVNQPATLLSAAVETPRLTSPVMETAIVSAPVAEPPIPAPAKKATAILPLPVMPVLPAVPVPAADHSFEKTTPHPVLPDLPVPLLPPAAPLQSPPIVKAPATAAPRRKFVRPSGAAVHELNSVLHQAFDAIHC
jgi:hypothetical protein